MQSQQKFLYPVNFTLQFSYPNPPKKENPAPGHYKNSRVRLLFLAHIPSITMKIIKPNPSPTNPIVDPQDCCYGNFQIARSARKWFFFPLHQWGTQVYLLLCTWAVRHMGMGKRWNFSFHLLPPSPSAVIQPFQFMQFNLEFMRFPQIFNNSKLYTKELEFAS